jgi:hypothetical protein
MGDLFPIITLKQVLSYAYSTEEEVKAQRRQIIYPSSSRHKKEKPAQITKSRHKFSWKITDKFK